MTLRITACGRSDVGRVRTSNEDSWGVFPELQFYMVADGMGGHAAGEVASRLATDVMREFLETTRQPNEITWPTDLDRTLPLPIKRLVTASRLANDKIFHASRSNSKFSGMGTTMVSVLIEQNIAHIGHVGDSRAYLVRNGKIQPLTADHSLVNDYISQGLLTPAEAVRHPLKHVITRALGSNARVDVDVKTLTIQSGDLFLLCSDGLSNLVNEAEIQARCLEAQSDSKKICDLLVDLANQKGGEDNITVVAISSTAV